MPAAGGGPMVTTMTLQPVASFIFRAASRAFMSSGFVMVCMEARFSVPSGFTATLPEVSGTCLMETMIFMTVYLLSYFTPRRLEMTMRWTSDVPS